MARTRTRLLRAAVGVLAVLALGAGIAWSLLGPGGLFLLRFQEGAAGFAPACSTEATTLALRGGRTVRIRVYAPPGGHERLVLVIHGVHHGGYDEERLVYFARRLVQAGYAVATPEMEDLKRYEIAPRTVDDIEELIAWAGAHPLARESRRDPRIGVVGISFGGGLAISAAGRFGADRAPAFVFAFGGHGDLARTMRFLSQGEPTAGGRRAPHPYGQAVELRMFAERLVPAADVEPLRGALLAYLENRRGEAKLLASGLGPEARNLVRLALDGDADALGPILAPLVDGLDADPSLSPERQPPPLCPTYLLHGADDDVIPASETAALAADLERRGAEVRALVTDLIQHVELKAKDAAAASPSLSSYLRMARFWTALLGE
jgi:dienelactone hydrolase